MPLHRGNSPPMGGELPASWLLQQPGGSGRGIKGPLPPGQVVSSLHRHFSLPISRFMDLKEYGKTRVLKKDWQASTTMKTPPPPWKSCPGKCVNLFENSLS